MNDQSPLTHIGAIRKILRDPNGIYIYIGYIVPQSRTSVSQKYCLIRQRNRYPYRGTRPVRSNMGRQYVKWDPECHSLCLSQRNQNIELERMV